MNGVLRSGDIRAKIEEWLKYSRLLSVCNVGECVLLGEGAGGSPAPVRLVLVPSGLAELGRTFIRGATTRLGGRKQPDAAEPDRQA